MAFARQNSPPRPWKSGFSVPASGSALHQRRVITTSRYAASTTMAPSVARLNFATSSSSSERRLRFRSASSAAKMPWTGIEIPRGHVENSQVLA